MHTHQSEPGRNEPMSVIALPPVLQDKLGRDAAQALVELINESQADFKVDVIEICEERFETRLTQEAFALRKETSDLRVELIQQMADLETRLTRQMADLETRLTHLIESGRSETLKWMLVFWVGQFAVLLGILFAFFKH